MKEKGLWVLKLNLKKSFQKDFDKLLLNGFDDSVLNKVILRKKEPLSPQFQDHSLKGKWKPFRECHIKRQLFNFLNSIKTKQKRALEKLKEIQAQKQRIKKALQFKALHLTENGYTIEEEREILARAKDTKNHLCFKSVEDFKKHCENLRFKNADN